MFRRPQSSCNMHRVRLTLHAPILRSPFLIFTKTELDFVAVVSAPILMHGLAMYRVAKNFPGRLKATSKALSVSTHTLQHQLRDILPNTSTSVIIRVNFKAGHRRPTQTSFNSSSHKQYMFRLGTALLREMKRESTSANSTKKADGEGGDVRE